MNRIAQIIPYFGKWPEWFDLYLYSCGQNKMIDFIYYTDCPIPDTVYPNTKFVQISFDDYCALAGKRLGIDYKIKQPYKLTDLKPFLGAVHEPELRKYNFWGFGDLDLCYGNLSMILNEKFLKKYDLITTHCYHIAGHFTIMKNNEYYRTLCFKIIDWQAKLCDSKHYALDEGEWSNLVYPRLKFVRFIWDHLIKYIPKTNFFSFLNIANEVVANRQHFHEYLTSPIPKESDIWRYSLQNNRLINNKGKEIPYLHFLFFKKTPWLETEYYWKNDYYQLNNPNDYNCINFSLYGIKGK